MIFENIWKGMQGPLFDLYWTYLKEVPCWRLCSLTQMLGKTLEKQKQTWKMQGGYQLDKAQKHGQSQICGRPPNINPMSISWRSIAVWPCTNPFHQMPPFFFPSSIVWRDHWQCCPEASMQLFTFELTECPHSCYMHTHLAYWYPARFDVASIAQKHSLTLKYLKALNMDIKSIKGTLLYGNTNPNWVLIFDCPKRVLNNARLGVILFQTWALDTLRIK